MKSTIATIDFGTSKVVTLVAEQTNSLRCNIVAQVNVPYDGYSDGQWNNPEQMKSVIDEAITGAEKQIHNREIKEIHLGVPGDFTRVYVVEVTLDIQGTDPIVTERHIQQIFDQADAKAKEVPGTIIHRSPAWFMIDGGNKTLKPVGVKGRQLKAMVSFVLADNFFLADVSARMRERNIVVKGFFSSCTGEAMLFVPQTARDHTALLLDIGYLCTDVMVIEGDAIIFQETLPRGGVDLTLALVNDLQIQMEEAEKIKREFRYGVSNITATYSTSDGNNAKIFDQKQVAPAIQGELEELCKQINECLENNNIKLGTWSNCYLTGGGVAFNSGGKEFIASCLQRNVSDIEIRTSKLNSPNYTSAMGLLNLVMDIAEMQKPADSGVKGFFSRLFGD